MADEWLKALTVSTPACLADVE